MFKRIISTFLAALTLLGSMSLVVNAAEDQATTDTVVSATKSDADF